MQKSPIIDKDNKLTYIAPNCFLADKTTDILKIDNMFCLTYSSKEKKDFTLYRTTMHCMIILLQGSKIVRLNDMDVGVNSREICFLAQNNYFMSEKIDKNSNYKAVIVYFDDKFIFDFIRKYQIQINSIDKTNIVKINYSQDELLDNNISLFQNYVDKKLNNNLLKLKIEEIILHSIKIDEKSFLSFINSIISTSQDRIRFILESNIDSIYTIDDMCELTRATSSHLRKYIKKEYNLTPKIWLDEKRLEKATLMLKSTDKTITHIATECGYSTISWFISQFKKQYNKTPKEFRKSA